MSVARIASKDSEGLAFMCLTRMPALTGSVQGADAGPAIDLDQAVGALAGAAEESAGAVVLEAAREHPAAEACSAEPIVSPSKASTVLPSKLNSIVLARSMRSPGLGAGARSRLRQRPGQAHALDLICGGVAIGLKPPRQPER